MAEQGRIHQMAVRVYYEDTDSGGIVYYANYLRYAERARTELLRSLGVESSNLMNDDGIALAVRRCLVDYIKPAVLDDALVVETEIKKIGGASLEARQTVLRDGEMLVSMDIKLGCLELSSGRPKGMPGKVRAKLLEYFENAENQMKKA